MNKIKELRNSLGMTLQEFGDQVGKPKQTIYRWETEQRRIKAEDARIIAQEFNVSINWLMGYEAPPRPDLESEELSLLAMFSLLTLEEKKLTIAYISNLIMERKK